LLTYAQGVEAFRVTDRLSDSERALLMGETLQRAYNCVLPPSLTGILGFPGTAFMALRSCSRRAAAVAAGRENCGGAAGPKHEGDCGFGSLEPL
jgi:hypothetical protein